MHINNGKYTKGPYSEPVECSSNFHTQFLKDMFYRFNSHLRLGLSVLYLLSKLSGETNRRNLVFLHCVLHVLPMFCGLT